MSTAIIILAAGQGSRMKSELPKVLHRLAGKPLVQHVLNAAKDIEGKKVVVTGHHGDQVRAALSNQDVEFVTQQQQLGTGHAVAQALPAVGETEKALVLYGDVPLLRAETIAELLSITDHQTLALLTVDLPNPKGYGRIIRNAMGEVTAIIEEKDASDEQREICEVNTGIMAVTTKHLQQWLPELDNSNAQGEYYLTDLIAIAREQGVAIATRKPHSIEEVEGVNDRLQLSRLERHLQLLQAEQLMRAGNTLTDPARFDCRGNLQTGLDNLIDINCVFEGEVTLGSGISIGPNCYLKDCTIADNVTIKANTIIEGATIERGADLGPFARIRPGTHLSEKSRVGNFVELKNTHLGIGSKANHLAYVGDSQVGDGCNIGAGTITCNYDGANKYKTTMGDNVFIGSNSTLVAPVTLDDGAFVGAGSTVTKDVGSEHLAIGRGKQRNITGWKRPLKDK